MKLDKKQVRVSIHFCIACLLWLGLARLLYLAEGYRQHKRKEDIMNIFDVNKLTHKPTVGLSKEKQDRQTANIGRNVSTDSNTRLPNKTAVAKEVEKEKLILFYTTLYGTEIKDKYVNNKWGSCQWKCKLSRNRADYERSDAVIFHLFNKSPKFIGHGYREFVISDLPNRTSKKQKWVLLIREPNAFYYSAQLKLLRDMFNLTLTFQRDADVSIPYGVYYKLPPARSGKARVTMNDFTKKKGNVTWLVSNCITSSRREDYVKQLEEYVKVDQYGDCSTGNQNVKKNSRSGLSKRYKFYLAFENSDCDDYMTEKFWNSLLLGMIPIVRERRVDYQRLAPPNSYIHVDEFNSLESLARHLDMVASNFTLYSQYHEWRLKYGIRELSAKDVSNWMCHLCQKVHEATPQYADIYERFSEDTRCNTLNLIRNRTGERMKDIENYTPLTP